MDALAASRWDLARVFGLDGAAGGCARYARGSCCGGLHPCGATGRERTRRKRGRSFGGGVLVPASAAARDGAEGVAEGAANPRRRQDEMRPRPLVVAAGVAVAPAAAAVGARHGARSIRRSLSSRICPTDAVEYGTARPKRVCARQMSCLKSFSAIIECESGVIESVPWQRTWV